MLGTFMAVLDGTVVNTGLPKIMASFGTGLDKVQWIISAYMLAMAVMLGTLMGDILQALMDPRVRAAMT